MSKPPEYDGKDVFVEFYLFLLFWHFAAFSVTLFLFIFSIFSVLAHIGLDVAAWRPFLLLSSCRRSGFSFFL